MGDQWRVASASSLGVKKTEADGDREASNGRTIQCCC